MKTLAGCLAVLLLAVSAVRAEDDRPPPSARFSAGAYLSYWNAEDFDDLDLSGAVGLGVVGQFRFHKLLGVELRTGGYVAGGDEDEFVEGEGWSEIDTTLGIVPLEIGLVGFWPVDEGFCLYGGPGAGYYLFDGEIRVSDGPWDYDYDLDLDDEGGFYVLFGARFQPVRNVGFFAEGKYTWVETSIEADGYFYDADVDVDCDGLGVNLGMIFTF